MKNSAYSKQHINTLTQDLQDIADHLDDKGKGSAARALERAAQVLQDNKSLLTKEETE